MYSIYVHPQDLCTPRSSLVNKVCDDFQCYFQIYCFIALKRNRCLECTALLVFAKFNFGFLLFMCSLAGGYRDIPIKLYLPYEEPVLVSERGRPKQNEEDVIKQHLYSRK